MIAKANVLAVLLIISLYCSCVPRSDYSGMKGPNQGQGTGVYENSIGMVFVRIPSGKFMMGSPEGQGRTNEHPQHEVEITGDFYIGKFEVRQTEWQSVMGSNPSHFKGDGLPVESITYDDILEFIQKLNKKEPGEVYRLPTEAEWEYACRAGSKKRYFWGGESVRDSADFYAWHGGNSEGHTHAVGTKRPNAWGLYDMIGNLWEWCSDWYANDYYSQSPVLDPRGPETGEQKVIRGNDFVNGWRACYTTLRVGSDQKRADREDIGFRLVKEVRK